jgi:hypothetical protein
LAERLLLVALAEVGPVHSFDRHLACAVAPH